MYRAAARTTSPLSSSMVSLSASDRDTTRRFGRDRSCNYCATPCQTWRRSTLSTTSKARIQPCCFGNTPILGRSRAVCFPMCCARWLTRLLLHTLLGAGVLVQLPAASVHAGSHRCNKLRWISYRVPEQRCSGGPPTGCKLVSHKKSERFVNEKP